ncbi:MAG TPA: UvrD-helicase domain-containing protein [Dongiaceae bacterium]|jgi:DNA helicase-2/ATP-dependent DNA helicase PcrA|nr:UvrD-helicase domain-containing protein [Dongiaceae bacterium]
MNDSTIELDLKFPYLAGLNDRQRDAVLTQDGPVLVLAGAGTGKTRALTTRLSHLLMTGKARPFEIMAVTFTNKAAGEMRARVSHLIGRPVEGWWLGTFHALAARILRQHAEAAGLKPNFTIIDTDDQLRLVKQIIQAEGLDSQKWPSRVVHGIIERWKDRGLTPDKVSAAEQAEVGGGRILGIYREYQQRLATLNACDFGDLLLHNVSLFSKDAEILARYQRQFRYILVDEYQDSNVVQYLWLRLLAQAHRNICVVGDDDQSIYGWRGAEVENILRFEHDFPGAKVIRLEQNYRSTPHILAAASGLIAQNEGRLGKTLWTDVAEGEKVKLSAAWDGEEEARKIGEEIENLQRNGVSLNDIAILVRAGFQTREFEERFITLGLRYRVIGGPRFYERQEIRDALAYLRLVNQPDDGLAFERIVNVPKRGLGDATLKQVNDAARGLNVSLPEAARRIVETDELKPAPRRTLGQLVRDLENWRKLAETTPHAELAQIVLDESGYTAMWQNDKSIEAPGRLENLKELIHAMEEFDSLGGFLEHVSLVMENAAASDGEMITIMTLHGAKGLEFDIVFLPGWEEGLFPSQRSLDENGVKGLEEERRLAYVGITRARKRALISYAANRRVHNMWQNALPSRFIAELPKAHIEREDDQLFRPSERYMGPPSGWGRAPLREGFGRRGGTLIDLSAEAVVQTGTGRYPSGARIFHQKFGYGKVLHSEGDKLEIAFDKAGVKKVMASFVMPAEKAG